VKEKIFTPYCARKISFEDQANFCHTIVEGLLSVLVIGSCVCNCPKSCGDYFIQELIFKSIVLISRPGEYSFPLGIARGGAF
jgi:hypothetical protein